MSELCSINELTDRSSVFKWSKELFQLLCDTIKIKDIIGKIVTAIINWRVAREKERERERERERESIIVSREGRRESH